MVSSDSGALLLALSRWMENCAAVHSAVLFGSHARSPCAVASADEWSDIDFHLIVDDNVDIAAIDWDRELPGFGFIVAVPRTATGGVRKVTLVFILGEADLIIVPRRKMQLAQWGMRMRLHNRWPMLADALNAMATIMSGGYRFVKGEQAWAGFYRTVVTQMPGVRISDLEAIRLAHVFLCDLLWTKQKLRRGELIAAQRMLHRSLVETNVVLLHELRLRLGLPTFQQARRLEQLAGVHELEYVRFSAALDAVELARGADKCLSGLTSLMHQLVPAWRIPGRWRKLLDDFSVTPEH